LRADENDGAFGFTELGKSMLYYGNDSEEIGVEVGLDSVDVCICDAGEGLQDTGVQDEGREGAEAGEGEVDGSLVVGILGHVALDQSELVGMFRSQGL
jgi:hypothetical protein